MKIGPVSRRTALLTLGALTAPLKAGAFETLQPLANGAIAQVRFRAIRIDVSPLQENANRPAAEWLSQDLPGLLQKAFAAHMAPRDPTADTLLVRIDLISFGHASVNNGGLFGGWDTSNATDSIEGAGVILSPRGTPIATYPLLSSVQISINPVDTDISFVRSRVATLAQSFAWWLPGQMGL
jgi:hypothetical protein